jgi:hypothetical protein
MILRSTYFRLIISLARFSFDNKRQDQDPSPKFHIRIRDAKKGQRSDTLIIPVTPVQCTVSIAEVAILKSS